MQLHTHAVLHARMCVLRREKGSDSMLGGVSLEYDPTAGPTKFMVGCEQGAGRVEKHPQQVPASPSSTLAL